MKPTLKSVIALIKPRTGLVEFARWFFNGLFFKEGLIVGLIMWLAVPVSPGLFAGAYIADLLSPYLFKDANK